MRYRTKTQPRGHFLSKGTFFMLIAMLDAIDFFEKQVKDCNTQAARAANKADREFWQHLADRWAHVLQAEKK